MKVERNILVFKKKGDSSLVKEINIDHLDIPKIKKLFKLLPDDPKFYRPYRIEKEQYETIVQYVPELKVYPWNKFHLTIEAVTV
jgi:hypothetical protein